MHKFTRVATATAMVLALAGTASATGLSMSGGAEQAHGGMIGTATAKSMSGGMSATALGGNNGRTLIQNRSGAAQDSGAAGRLTVRDTRNGLETSVDVGTYSVGDDFSETIDRGVDNQRVFGGAAATRGGNAFATGGFAAERGMGKRWIGR